MSNLCGHLAGCADDLAPAIAQRALTAACRVVVSPPVAEGLVDRMRPAPIELDHEAMLVIPDVSIPGPSDRCGLALVASSSRKSVSPLHLAVIPALQGRVHARLQFAAQVVYQAAPPQVRPWCGGEQDALG